MKIRSALITTCAILITAPLSVQAALLQLPNTPLFSGSQVTPNVFFTLDDSGSMDDETMIDTYWQDCAYDPYVDGSNTPKTSSCGAKITSSRLYFYHEGSSTYTTSMTNYLNLIRSCDQNPSSCQNQGRKDWRSLSNDFNTLYYNPNVDYAPWHGVCSSTNAPCIAAKFNAARNHPFAGVSGYTQETNLSGFSYIVWIDNKGYSGVRPRQGSGLNVTNTPNNIVDLWDSHIKITINTDNVMVYLFTYAPFYNSLYSQGIAESKAFKINLTSSTDCYNILGSADLVRKIVNGEYSYSSQNTEGCKSITDLRQNYANWFQYHRSRFLTAQNAIDTVVEENPQYRYGLSFINNSLFISAPIKDDLPSLLVHNDSLQKRLNQQTASGGTPLRVALNKTGSYFQGTLSGKPSPIIYACQQNFNILITDGYWNDESFNNAKIGDQDKDGFSKTLADVASYYYETDLSSFPNIVSPNPNDSAIHQHLVNFTVGFGVTGNLVDTDGDSWPNPALNKNSVWGGDPFRIDNAKIDDLWHAAFNSRGTFLSAQSPDNLASNLSSALGNISDRMGSASSAAQSSSVLNKNSYVYQARFNSKLWYGELLAYPMNMDGTIGTIAAWNAHCIFSGGVCSDSSTEVTAPINYNTRVIITKDWSAANSGGIPFRWPANYTSLISSGALPQTIKNYLKTAPYASSTTNLSEISTNQNYGNALINYLRGDTTYDGKALGTSNFRQRYGLLGDIVHSTPIYINKPDRYYPDLLMSNSYTQFKTMYKDRPPMIGFGANDGMYHILNAHNGSELLAYVPGASHITSTLGNYSQPTYTHRFYVDGFSQSSDVYFNDAWHTILVSGLRQGGQGIFALDITNPSEFTEENAKNILLWEFTDQDDKDLGYTYSQMQVGLVNHNGTKRWAVIFGNGYNNTEGDAATSTSGKAALYIVFIDGGLDGKWTEGTDYIKLSVGAGSVATPNGLATPYPIDVNQDYVIDYIYAGDLNGQLWKFNLTNSSPSNWTGSAFFQAKHSTTGDQKITTMPIIGPHPDGIEHGVLIYFGTGKFLEPSDNTTVDAVTQAFYAVLDKLDGTLPTKSKLLQQSIVQEVKVSYDTDEDGTEDFKYELRVTTNQEIDWDEHMGWYLNLSVADRNRGERVFYAPILRKGHVIFTTLSPNESACSYGGDSWIMELNAFSGARLAESPFDLNKDQEIDKGDEISVVGLTNPTEITEETVSGMKSSVGITATPTVFNMENTTNETKVISGSNGIDSFIENGRNLQDGRKTWRQLQ